MTIEQPNRKRFLHAIDGAIQYLNSEAHCYGYLKEPEYEKLLDSMQAYRNHINTTGVWYELVLGNQDGMFLSGTSTHGDNVQEALGFHYKSLETNWTIYMVLEKSLKDILEPSVQWQVLPDNTLRITRWDERVHRIIFTNHSGMDIAITMDGEKQMHLTPGKTDWWSHSALLKKY